MRLVVAILFVSSCTFAQTIKRAEYFFDADPGKGNGTSLSVVQGATINETHSISVASLSNGPHTFSMRVLDSNGTWSQSATRTFFIVTPVINLTSTTIKKAEYFFDLDPGMGQAHPLTISSSSSQNNSFLIDISSLTAGFHQLCIRYRDDLFRWSPFAQRTFYIVPTLNLVSSASIKKAEYFFDSDPGMGNGTSLPVSASASQNNLFAININSLSTGFHQLAIRYQDDKGHWSHFTHRTFYIVPSTNLTLVSSIKKAEYFFDTDPGTGHGLPLSIPSGPTEDNTFALDVSSLAKGFHQLMIRYQDDKGRWSAFAQRTFYIFPGSIVSTTVKRIEYFIDNDPGFDNGTALNFTGTTAVNQLFNIDLGTTPPGNHMLYVRVKDSNGYWSYPVSSAAFSIANCTVPTAPIGTNGSRCDVGSVTLSASGANGGQQYRWYADGLTNTIAFTGASYSTPSLNVSTDFYASVYDPSTACESSRTKISAVVTSIPKPVLNPSGSLALCQGNSVVITAPVGYAGYSWSNSATTQSISASTSASYSVTVSDGTCTSPPSDPLVLTVVPQPSKPIIQSSASTTICGSGSVSLSAVSTATGYLWSTGETTPQITVSTTGNYSLRITDSNNCQSVASDPIPVQVLTTPNQPIISVTGSTTLCNNSSVILSAPLGFTSYQWSTGATTQQIAVSAAGNYSVSVSNGTCTSVASNAVAVTIGTPPSKPPVQVFGNTTICGSGSVILTAPAGAASYLWSDGTSTSQSITVSSAGNYSVQITDANNCQSAASDQVTVKVVAVPAKPSITASGKTELCINSSVILSAPPGFTNYQWSNGANTQQILASTAANYSVEVGNGPNCLSAPSDAIAVTLTNLPCGGGPPPIVVDPNYVPPSIANTTFNIPVGNSVSFNMKKLIAAGSYNIDYTTLKIVSKPSSGPFVQIDASDDLIIDYSGNSFVGSDSIGVVVCDSLGACTTRDLRIEVTASVEVFNAVSPFPDGLNDFLYLKYIDKIAETKKNKVTIVDRWGNEVFSTYDYNNVDRVFRGNDNSGKELPSGTYYYRIDFDGGRPTLSGFLSLKR